ncbi:Pycsar system effector family protein [Kitasatospora sp. NPDC004723]|uniref:Pycsar system effector family protein n=1 Tax=Kitasatospora sp. NPDC004723 TaxID=3154288 RepID=UPI0033A72531
MNVQTGTPAEPGHRPVARLTAPLTSSTTEVIGELQRTDAKAAGIGATSAAGLTTAAALCGTPPPLTWTTTAVIAVAVTALAGALGLALVAVRPHLKHGQHLAVSYLDFARLTPDQLLEAVATHHDADALAASHAQRLVALSRLARRKYRLLRVSVDLLCGGLALGATAIALSWLGH